MDKHGGGDGDGDGDGGGGSLDANPRMDVRKAKFPHSTLCGTGSPCTDLGCRVVHRAHPGPQSLIRVEVTARTKVDQTDLHGGLARGDSAIRRRGIVGSLTH